MESIGITTRKMLAHIGLVGIGTLLGSGLVALIGARRESGIAGGVRSSAASDQMFDWPDEGI